MSVKLQDTINEIMASNNGLYREFTVKFDDGIIKTDYYLPNLPYWYFKDEYEWITWRANIKTKEIYLKIKSTEKWKDMKLREVKNNGK